jgi:flagella basal body P-ring formation protein FlgA
MNNPRPTISMRKKVQLMVILTLLAWATQTLRQQWGFGQAAPAGDGGAAADPRVLHVDLDAQTATLREPAAAATPAPPATGGVERFVPGTARFAAGAALELRSEARVTGAEVRLKQVCRWNEADREVFEPLADLVLARLDEKTPFTALGAPQIKQTLRDAGANLAVIRFSGPTTCTVSRSDVAFDEGDALQKWADAAQAKAGAAALAADDAAAAPATAPAAQGLADGSGGAVARADDGPVKTLRTILAADLSGRLGIPQDQIELRFNPRDEKVLKLAEPLFKFHVESKRIRNLGSVVWDVTLTTADGGADAQTVTIAGSARAWQQQVVLTRPLSYKQVVRAEDLTGRRTLVDRLPDDALLETPQIVGQQAARDLKPGTVMTARLVDAVPLVTPGQFVTVSLERGGVRVKTVARAMEGGSFGQTVRVKNEATKDVYEVVLTGPQEGTLGPPAVPTGVAAGAPAPKTVKPERGTASLGND